MKPQKQNLDMEFWVQVNIHILKPMKDYAIVGRNDIMELWRRLNKLLMYIVPDAMDEKQVKIKAAVDYIVVECKFYGTHSNLKLIRPLDCF